MHAFLQSINAMWNANSLVQSIYNEHVGFIVIVND